MKRMETDLIGKSNIDNKQLEDRLVNDFINRLAIDKTQADKILLQSRDNVIRKKQGC